MHIQLDGELVFPAMAIKELRPVDFPSFQQFVESFFVRVQANSEDFESMGMVLLIKLSKLQNQLMLLLKKNLMLQYKLHKKWKGK